MKYLTAILLGIVSMIALSFLLSPILTEAYISYYDISRGPGGEEELIKLLLFVEWPIFFVFGFISGYILHVKYLVKKSP